MSYTQTMLRTAGTLGPRSEGGRLTRYPADTTAGIIHDLGNLIQIASSAVNIVARNPSIDTATLKPVIAGARASLERAGALVRQTIGLARERASSAEQVNLATCLTDVQALFQITGQRNIRLDVDVDTNLPLLTCDPLALQNAVLNLLFNARDAMPNGGTVSVRAEAISLDSGKGIELRIADRGIGMKPDTMLRAFDPFFTTKTDGMGGVGLSMVERFVQEVGGRVLIESEYGVGTTVRLQMLLSAST
jgi:signal transduction histidine kinase